MTGSLWDAPQTHAQLARLSLSRYRFRLARTTHRILSPRRILATSLSVVFVAAYLLNGIFILSARAPADPERLRLWLSGGMVIYAIYHSIRCAWTASVPDLELTSAEKLWLGGAPIRRSSIAIYHLGNTMVAAMSKTLLLAVVLAGDVDHLILLVAGIFASLVLLELIRQIIQRLSAALDDRGRLRMRIITTLVAGAATLQVLSHVLAWTPAGSPTWMYILNLFRSLGETAACDAIQWLSLPWLAPAELAVTSRYGLQTAIHLGVTAAIVPLAIVVLVHVDAWASERQLDREKTRLREHRFGTSTGEEAKANSSFQSGGFAQSGFDQRLPGTLRDAVAVMARQAISVKRYKATVLFSFAVPTLLCLSPLVTGQVTEQWFYVVGGIAMCTMLLAPPALRIDFRRDLRRMLLLRSLPIRPISMVLGQLTLPILITIAFQWITIAVAAAVTQPGWSQWMLWTGMLNALAVFTFAAENALYLTYPHHERSEGLAMMVRAKLTFVGKAAIIAAALGLLLAWTLLCKHWMPPSLVMPALVGGALLATWTLAAIAIAATAWCWQRFDLSYDVPPE